MRIGFDIDGVIGCFGTFMYGFLTQAGMTLPAYAQLSKIPFWDKAIDIPKEVKRRINKEVWDNPEVWKRIPRITWPEDLEALRATVNEDKHELFFITSRPTKAQKSTEEWLVDLLKIDNVQVICGAKAKGPLCKAMNIAFFLEDNIINAYDVAKNQYTRSYMIRNHETIQYIPYLKPMNIEYVDSIRDYIRTITGKTNAT